MRFLRTALLAGAAILGGAAVAHATPYSSTFTIDIYNGSGGGDINNPNNQAVNTNPMITGSPLDVVTYTGALNFALSSGTDTIGAFLSSGGGTISGLTPSVAATTLSTAGFGTTTVLDIFGSTGHSLAGSISHDDGASLYQGGIAVASSPFPTTDTSTPYSLASGAFELVYVEANGLPADLTMDVTAVPEPASMALLGIGLLGLGMVRRRRNQA